jgi:hypothetical protein
MHLPMENKLKDKERVEQDMLVLSAIKVCRQWVLQMPIKIWIMICLISQKRLSLEKTTGLMMTLEMFTTQTNRLRDMLFFQIWLNQTTQDWLITLQHMGNKLKDKHTVVLDTPVPLVIRASHL